MERTFRDGHTDTWWAADLDCAGFGLRHTAGLVVATNDPATLPGVSTWYLLTNLRHPSTSPERQVAWRQPTWQKWCGCTG